MNVRLIAVIVAGMLPFHAGAGPIELTQDLGGLDVTAKPGKSATIRILRNRGGMPRSAELRCREKVPDQE